MRLKSCALVASATVLTAGCAAGGSGSPEAQQQPPERPGNSISVSNPKNAAGPEVCQLLPPDAAAQVGVEPNGEVDDKNINPDAPDTCAWESSDGSLSVSFAPVEGRSLQAYYDTKNQYQTYEEFEISGHPAVIATKDDTMNGSCDVWVATKPDQVVGSTVFLPSEDSGEVDPCEVNKKMFELSMPSWPAA
ncbi:DUF3558 domain-containing protein [Allosaccharopolyspora coralli]|nr:DUF3558 domain-containing protein [Allosaccharopolyspora coralli]